MEKKIITQENVYKKNGKQRLKKINIFLTIINKVKRQMTNGREILAIQFIL